MKDIDYLSDHQRDLETDIYMSRKQDNNIDLVNESISYLECAIEELQQNKNLFKNEILILKDVIDDLKLVVEL